MTETGKKTDSITKSSTKSRSPRCPSISLEAAIKKTEEVFLKENLNPAPADVVAQHMNYKNSRSGAAAQMLASVSYYGLLARPIEGKLAVDRKYQTYKFSPDENTKNSILIEWLKTPQIFSELLDKYSQGLPSDANLKFDFIEKGFNIKTAEECVKNFRQSVEFAKFYSLVQAPSTSEQFPNFEEKYTNTPTHTSKQGALEPDIIPIRLSKGRKAFLTLPSPFFESDKDIIKSFVDLQYVENDEDKE